jgi:hypothetical protein
MVTGFVIVGAWFLCSLMLAFLIGGAVRLRDTAARPTPARVVAAPPLARNERLSA